MHATPAAMERSDCSRYPATRSPASVLRSSQRAATPAAFTNFASASLSRTPCSGTTDTHSPSPSNNSESILSPIAVSRNAARSRGGATRARSTAARNGANRPSRKGKLADAAARLAASTGGGGSAARRAAWVSSLGMYRVAISKPASQLRSTAACSARSIASLLRNTACRSGSCDQDCVANVGSAELRPQLAVERLGRGRHGIQVAEIVVPEGIAMGDDRDDGRPPAGPQAPMRLDARAPGRGWRRTAAA